MYGESRNEALLRAQALALLVIAEGIHHGELSSMPLAICFVAARREAVQKVLLIIDAASGFVNHRRFSILNLVEMTFPPTLVQQIRRAGRPTFWTPSWNPHFLVPH